MTRILAIEKEPLLLRLCRAILEPQGYEIIGALDGEQAMELLDSARGRFVLIILDVGLFEGVRWIQDIHGAFPMIPILNCSAKVRKGLRSMDQGLCAGSILKPFDVQHFIKAVHEVACMELERRSGQDRRKHEVIPDNMVNRRKTERRRSLHTS